MAHPELSSNWKLLQARLQHDKPRAAKRKAPSDETPTDATSKRRALRRTGGEAAVKAEAGTGTVKDRQKATEKKTKPKAWSSSEAARPSSRAMSAIYGKPAVAPTSSRLRAAPPSTTLATVLASPASAPPDILNAGLTPGLLPGKYIALDCEMVGVGPHPDTSSVLARVSCVDFHGTQLYDSFVLPPEAVTDYRTPFSGITPALLRQARTFETVHADIAALLQGKVLVGHAVRNDLKVLMLPHPQSMTRDTSSLDKYRELVGGRKPALRRLAREVLGVEIQGGEHCSVEDARVTMALFRREKAAFGGEVGRGGGEARMEKREERGGRRRGVETRAKGEGRRSER